MRGDVVQLGRVGYEEAWELQRSIAAEVLAGARPDTVLFVEHPPIERIIADLYAKHGELEA